MRKLFFLIAFAAMAIVALLPQVRSLEDMGVRRFAALATPGKEVVVGVCWPFSINQDGMANGLQLALDEINATSGAAGYTIRLIMRDHSYDPENIRNIAVEFAQTPEMSAVIGYYDDTPAVKASLIFEPSRLLHMIIGANNSAMTMHGFQYIIRTTHSSDKLGPALARISVDRGYRKVALIWEKGAYGEDLAYQYHVGLDRLDGDVVYQWTYTRHNPDFRLPVNELRGIDADVIFFCGLEPWAGDFLRKAHEVGLSTPIIGAFSNTPEMHQRAGPALEGAMYFDIYDMEATSIKNQEFVKKYQARFGMHPDAWAAQAYDALYILAKALEHTGSRNPLDLAYAIRYMDAWEGVNGRYQFDKNGNMEDKPIYLMEIRQGRPKLIQQSSPPQAPSPSNSGTDQVQLTH